MDLGNDTEDVVGIIALYRNEFLLVRGAGGKWSFPKGRRRENETSYEGAIREAREEAGINLTGIYPEVTLNLRYGTYFIFNLWRLPQLLAPSTPEEVLEVAWHDFQSMRNQEKNADLKCFCKMNTQGKLKVTFCPAKEACWEQNKTRVNTRWQPSVSVASRSRV